MGSARPTVSVIIPVYNKADYLARTLESVLAQDYREFEVIVVDDGSTDGSHEIATAYSDNIKYTSQERAGAGAARNRALKMAVGEFVAFLDADDPWLPTKLRWQVTFMADHPEVQWCATNHWTSPADKPGVRAGIPFEEPATEPVWVIVDWFEAMANKQIAFQTSGVMLRRRLIREIGLFDDRIPSGQDFEYWVRIAERHPDCGYCVVPCYTLSRDSRYSITFSETKKVSGRLAMVRRLIERSSRPESPLAFRQLVRDTCDRYIRVAIALGDASAANSILAELPPEWRSLRHVGYTVLSRLPVRLIRIGAMLFGRRLTGVSRAKNAVDREVPPSEQSDNNFSPKQ